VLLQILYEVLFLLFLLLIQFHRNFFHLFYTRLELGRKTNNIYHCNNSLASPLMPKGKRKQAGVTVGA
jgi:hypothetical protein